MRDAFTRALMREAAKDDRLMLVTGDLGFGVLKPFWETYPEQFVNAGIAEQSMTGLAAGLAKTGRTVLTYSIGNFPTLRCLEQIRNDCAYHSLNVKVVCVGGGFVYGSLGMSHHATEDIAVMRSLPNMTVLVPSDAASTRWATGFAVEKQGPVYLRLSRDVYPDLYDENTSFECGKGAVVRDGSDVTVIACGLLVHKAIEAAEIMAAKGVSVRVVDMYSVKPIDKELILKCAAETGAIVTAEEHNIYGGLGGAVSEVLAWGGAGVPTEYVGIQDTFTESGPYKELLAKYGVDANGVVAGIEKVLVRKKK